MSIYVDDLILVVDLLKDLEQTKEELSARFKMKDLGQLRYCLGIVCDQSTGCIKLNQRPYIDNLHRQPCEEIPTGQSMWSFNSG